MAEAGDEAVSVLSEADGWLSGILGRWRGVIAAAAVVAVVVIVAFAVTHLVSEVSYDDVMAALTATPWTSIGLAILLTGASFAALSVYDLSALRSIGKSFPYPIVAVTAFAAYAVGNVAGFGPLTGGAIRYRFYSRLGCEPADIARIVAFVTAGFGLGLAVVTGLGLVYAAEDVAGPLAFGPFYLRVLGLAILAGLLALLAIAKRPPERLKPFVGAVPSTGLIVTQLAATLVDIVASAGVLYVLLPTMDLGLAGFVAVYAVAVGLGVLSHVPAGLGVFEAVIVAVIGRSVPVDQVLSALVLYRLIYHGLPLFLATVLVTGVEVVSAAEGAAASRAIKAGARIAPRVLAAATLALGAVLVFSGVTPAADQRLDILSDILPLPIIEGAHFLESVVGLGLMVLARGLAHRLDGAWWAAVVLAAIAIALSLLKAIAISESLVLALLLIALIAARHEFTRPASLLHQRLTPLWFMAIATVIVTAITVLLFVYRDVEYSNELWWQFEFSAEGPRGLRALLGVALGAGAIAVWSLLRPAKGKTGLPTQEEIAEAVAIVEAQSFADANLVRMGDKALLFSEDRRAFIMYGRQAHSFVALFDPIGPRPSWPGLIWNFVEMAREAGGRAVFYQVSPEHLGLYADAGMRAFKLGEAAEVKLADFDLKGAKRASLRHAFNRGQREGLVFEFLPPEAVAAEFEALRAVSDGWLSQHKAREKRFSLGAFERHYVQSQPVAVVRRNGLIIAFATVMTTDLRDQATVDLMRSSADAPAGTMEFLFIALLQHLKAEGYQWFDLGMAPLSGLSESPAAPAWHRIGRAVFEHGERFYNFHGLRAFKSKFQPEWHPRYMAVAGGMSPMLALADVTVLIGGGLKGVVGK